MAEQLSREILYEVFGDESTCGQVVVYGFVGFRPSDLDKALAAVNEVKLRFNGDENTEVHCRSLFAGQNRAKSGWAHLTGHRPFFLCHEIAKAVRAVGVKGLVSVTNKTGLPKRMELSFPNGTSKLAKVGHDLGDKQLQQYLYSACAAYLAQNVGTDKVKIWVDEDSTKIDWFNGNKQAKNIHQIIKPAGFDPGKYKSLLEVADLFAYAAARVHAKDRRLGRMYFKMIYNCFVPQVMHFNLAPDQWDPKGDTSDSVVIR